MKEIEMSMARAGVTQDFFSIKTLTPIYPLAAHRFHDEEFYIDGLQTHEEQVKHETEINTSMKPLLREF